MIAHMNNLKFQGVIFYHFIVSSRQTTHTSMGSPSEKNEPQYTLSPSPAKWLTLSTVVTTQCCLKRRNNQNEFEAWCHGKTGYPLVDAGMRELNATGCMHNRVRMVVASFLCKHLLIDWRWGEAYFAKKLLDYELSSNNGNWQWAAGTGCDAAPYFRVFNPSSQLQKFDKDLIYVRKWVPEYGSSTYPKPIVDHAMARVRAIETYRSVLKPNPA